VRTANSEFGMVENGSSRFGRTSEAKLAMIINSCYDPVILSSIVLNALVSVLFGCLGLGSIACLSLLGA
jgi:hypothetical protein